MGLVIRGAFDLLIPDCLPLRLRFIVRFGNTETSTFFGQWVFFAELEVCKGLTNIWGHALDVYDRLLLYRGPVMSLFEEGAFNFSHRDFPCHFRVEWRGNIFCVHIFTFLSLKLACTFYPSKFDNFAMASRHQSMMHKLHKQILHGLLNSKNVSIWSTKN